MNLKLACCAAFIVGMGISHFAYKAYKYAKNRWNVPTFDANAALEQILKRGRKL